MEVRNKMLEMQEETMRRRALRVLQIFAAKWIVAQVRLRLSLSLRLRLALARRFLRPRGRGCRSRSGLSWPGAANRPSWSS